MQKNITPKVAKTGLCALKKKHSISGHLTSYEVCTYKSPHNLTDVALFNFWLQASKIPNNTTHALWQCMYAINKMTQWNCTY